MTGLALLTPPLCCDHDLHATYVQAYTLASIARALAPEAIDAATSLRALDGAVQTALLGAHEDGTDAERSVFAPRAHAGRDYARAMERLRSSWLEIVPVLREDLPRVSVLPATAGVRHVDADGREVPT